MNIPMNPEMEEEIQATIGRMIEGHTVRICDRCGRTNHTCMLERVHSWACNSIDICTACVRPFEEELFDDVRFLEEAIDKLNDRLSDKLETLSDLMLMSDGLQPAKEES